MLGEFPSWLPRHGTPRRNIFDCGVGGKKKRGTLGSAGLANEIIAHVSAWGKRWRLGAGLQRAGM